MEIKPTALRPQLSVEIGPSIFDQVSAAIVAGIMLLGFLFLVLFSIWWAPSVVHFPPGGGDPVTPDRDPKLKTVRDGDFWEPGVQEFPEVAVPQMQQLLTAAIGVVKSSPDFSNGDVLKIGQGLPFRRPKREADTDDAGVDFHKRWSIRFQADDIESYSKQLRFFKIDVAVIHQSRNSIFRVSDVGAAAKVAATDRKRENDTLRFHHQQPRMQRWDRELCERAGVEVADSILSHFYPASTQSILEQVEAKALTKADREINEVRKTIFKVVEKDGSLAFVVAEIQYR